MHGNRLSLQQLERVRDRVESTKAKIFGIQLSGALEAEKEKSKWRKKADRYCEAPEHKINKILGCEDLHMTYRNYGYYKELKKFCRKLLKKAETGADNSELIELLHECEQKTHSRDVSKRFQSLRLDLQQHCQDQHF